MTHGKARTRIGIGLGAGAGVLLFLSLLSGASLVDARPDHHPISCDDAMMLLLGVALA